MFFVDFRRICYQAFFLSLRSQYRECGSPCCSSTHRTDSARSPKRKKSSHFLPLLNENFFFGNLLILKARTKILIPIFVPT
jgi:hypothetical protein